MLYDAHSHANCFIMEWIMVFVPIIVCYVIIILVVNFKHDAQVSEPKPAPRN